MQEQIFLDKLAENANLREACLTRSAVKRNNTTEQWKNYELIMERAAYIEGNNDSSSVVCRQFDGGTEESMEIEVL